MLNRNTKVRPLAEELKEIGLDPDKTIGQIQRSTKLVEARLRGANGGGAPGYLRPVPKAKEQVTEQKPKDDKEAPITEGSEDGVELSEALKVIKTRRLTSTEKAKGRRLRRKTRGKRRMAGKMYRKRAKRRIKRVTKMKRKRYGTAGLAKLHKGRRRIVMQGESPLSNLREDLNRISESATAESSSAFEDAAYNSGLLAMYLGEMFEAFGDAQSAETMYDASDAAADLAEQLLGKDESDLTEEQQEMLGRVLDTMVKALRMYEAMGSPSLTEVLEFVEQNGDDEDEEDDEEGDDYDEDEDDEDDEE